MTKPQASLNSNSLLNVPNDRLWGKVFIVTGYCCVGSSLPIGVQIKQNVCIKIMHANNLDVLWI